MPFIFRAEEGQFGKAVLQSKIAAAPRCSYDSDGWVSAGLSSPSNRSNGAIAARMGRAPRDLNLLLV